MAKKNYQELTDSVIDLVGGKENIVFFTHCVTRLRFNVKDRGLVEKEKIEKLDGVVGSQWAEDQLQIIIGQAVKKVYLEICQKHGMEAMGAVDENLDSEKKKFTLKGLVNGMLDGLMGSVMPLIPLMIGGGMIKVIVMIMGLAGVSAENTTYMILNWMSSAFIYFLPVFLGATAAKKFGANMGIGMLLGGFLIFPDFMGAVAEGTALSIFGLPVYNGSYASSVVPIILSVWVLSKIEKFLNKYMPEILTAIFVPTLSILIMLPIMLVITAPMGFYVGKYVGEAVIWFYEKFGVLGISILSATKPLLTMTGMHYGLIPITINNFAVSGSDPFYMPASLYANMNQAAACLAVSIKAKGKKLKSVAASTAFSAFFAGITEPAMFGVTLKYKRPMIATMIGGAVGGMISGLFKVTCNAFPGSAGILTVPCYIGENGNLMHFILAMVVGAVVTFVATLILGFDEEEE